MGLQAFSIHAHFYQPPREDPLSGEIPLEPGAAPYQNWNEKIHDQCYRPNAELGVFERISFNVGPTLFQWIAEHAPHTLEMIVEQERRNFLRYGVGNGMAQSYNHTILPLSRLHDKITQVRWGIDDFEFRFGHAPAGMWLPEAAADNETLQVLADHGITFTILAPWQAEDQNLDVSVPYRVPLEMGKDISVFFYHQDLSMRISFDPGVSVDADRFIIETLAPKYRASHRKSDPSQLFIIASDGELYGHHQPFRDKFMAYLLNGALRGKSIQVTFPALWLQDHKPEKTMEVREKTSWSCHHGVLRWSGECGCAPHGEWKEPLRHALDFIADAIDDHFLTALEPHMVDPWELRHAYISVLHGKETTDELITRVLGRRLDDCDMEKIGLLLEAQYERQRMFTSCGWFFDDFDRIEPRNNVAYAAQAVWLTKLAVGVDLSKKALKWLKKVKSWRSGLSADVVFNHHLQRARTVEKTIDMTACP
jgi:alpha-amylase/alpha-mannosidase (GH57 family)